ncbi:hypothetical protein N0V82_006753 [Gnomoniopsis sp. IMI 355080]|nr:hypothetical protein N0V82_006753 [Gnomoniopsis sp. IMI 355080]
MKAFLYPLAAFFTSIFAQDINSLPACEPGSQSPHLEDEAEYQKKDAKHDTVSITFTSGWPRNNSPGYHILFCALELTYLFPPQKRTCLQNMLTEGPAYGCPNINNGSPAPDCLCSKPEFAYGVTDCSMESCPSGTDIDQVYQYGLQYCQSAQASASGTALAAIALFSSAAAGTTTTSPSSGTTSMSSSTSSAEPTTTIPVISTVTSNGSTIETTLGSSTSQTISSTRGANETSSGANQTVPITTRPVVSTVTEASTTRQTTVGSTTVFTTSSAGAGATMAAPRLLIPRFSGQQLTNNKNLVCFVRTLALTGLVVVGVQLGLGFGGW